MHRVATAISSDLDLERIVQTVTDVATELTGAKFGAFFYNTFNANGEVLRLYTLSGASREMFSGFGLPRKTELFAPTFEGVGVIRSGDIRRDPRYGLGEAGVGSGMPSGHLPVVSYLAVPVISRSGEVHGGLLFGHDRADAFTQYSERIGQMIAAHAAVAIDNARLLQQARFEIDERKRAEAAAAWLAAIVASSEDAIIGKNLDGVISSWNRGAERLFGFSAAEVIGRPCTIIVPEDRLHEEREMLAKVSSGEYAHLAETVRRRKDGGLIDVSLTSSPVYDAKGKVMGASKIARDITERRRAAERQNLLLREMDHRVKNLFALAVGLVSMSARSAATPQALAASAGERLAALARAHALTMVSHENATHSVRALELLRTILAPYTAGEGVDRERFLIRGTDAAVGGGALTSLALLFHEFATNAAKHGGLSVPEGRVTIDVETSGDALEIVWCESGGPPPPPEMSEGFGSRLEKATVGGQLGGTIERRWVPEGLMIRLLIPVARLGC